MIEPENLIRLCVISQHKMPHQQDLQTFPLPTFKPPFFALVGVSTNFKAAAPSRAEDTNQQE